MAQLKYWDGTAWVPAVVGAPGPTGATGPAGPSGVITVTAPITNSGTSTSATIGIDTTNFALLDTANTFTTTQTITPSSTSAKSLILSSATGTVNMQDWVANGGTSYVDSAGRGIFRAIGTNYTSPGPQNTMVFANSLSASVIGLVVKGATSQTANLQEWQDSAGTVLAQIVSNGRYETVQAIRSTGNVSSSFGGTSIGGSVLAVKTSSAGNIGLIVQGVASQTGDLQQWQDSAGTSLVTIGSTGNTWLRAGARVSGNYGGTQALLVQNDQNIIGITVKANATQTANLQEWQNSAGTVLASLSQLGAIRVSSSIGYVGGGGSQLVFQSGANPAQFIPTSAATIGLVVKGFASQTANLQEWQDSSGTVLASIGSGGVVTASQQINANGGIYAPWVGAGSGQIGTNALSVSSQYFGNPVATIKGISGQSATVLTVMAGASQTADLQQWQNSSGTVLGRVDNYGALYLSETVQIGPGTTDQRFAGGGLTIIHRGGTSAITFGIKAIASQTGNLTEWRTSDNVVRSFVNPNGRLIVRSSAIAVGTESLSVGAFNPTDIGIVVKGTASQTANLQEWQDSTGTVKAYVRNDGLIHSSSGILGTGTFVAAGAYVAGTQMASVIQTATNIGLIVKGAASQTADLQQWQDSAGGVLLGIDSTGSLNIGAGSSNLWRIKNQTSTVMEWQPSQGFMFLPYGASNKPVTIKGAASQTANLTEWQDSTGTVLAKVDSNGYAFTSKVSLLGTNPSIEDNAGVAPYMVFRSTGIEVNTRATTKIGLVVKGVASQTADLQQWQNSSGTTLGMFNAYGTFTANNRVYAGWAAFGSGYGTSAAAGNVVLIAKGVSGQTANLTEWQDSSGTVLANVDKDGKIFAPTATAGTNTTQVATTAFVQTALGSVSVPAATPTTVGTVYGKTDNPAIGSIVSLGYNSLPITTGYQNVAVGIGAGEIVSSGYGNTLLGHGAGYSLETGHNNIVIGTWAESSSASVNNEITIGDSAITKLRVPGLSLLVDRDVAFLGSSLVEPFQELPTNPTGNVDIASGTVVMYGINTTSNWTWNIRGSATQTVSSLIYNANTSAVATVALLANNGATGYYMTALQIDGVAQTVKWQGGTAPTSGNANATDVYIFTIIPTGASTYIVLGSQTKFA